ncbi:MAG: hypothetical protein ACOCSL_03570 [Thermoplasmatota archaeon]
MYKMNDEEILTKSKEAFNKVAERLEEKDEPYSMLDLKVMIGDELDYRLSEEEIATLAVAFQRIDQIYDMFSESSSINQNRMFR